MIVRVAVDIWWSRVIITGACHHTLLSPPLVMTMLTSNVLSSSGWSSNMMADTGSGSQCLHVSVPTYWPHSAPTIRAPGWHWRHQPWPAPGHTGRALQSLLAGDGGRRGRPAFWRPERRSPQPGRDTGHFWGFLQLHSSPLAMSVYTVWSLRGVRPGLGRGSDLCVHCCVCLGWGSIMIGFKTALTPQIRK